MNGDHKKLLSAFYATDQRLLEVILEDHERSRIIGSADLEAIAIDDPGEALERIDFFRSLMRAEREAIIVDLLRGAKSELLSSGRELQIAGSIDDKSIAACVDWLESARSGSGRELELTLLSPRGAIETGLALHEIIRLRRQSCNLAIVCLGSCSAVAALILQAGIRRMIGRNSLLALEKITGERGLNAIVMEVLFRDPQKRSSIRRRLSRSGKVIFSAEQAVAWGLADSIV